MTKIIFLAHDIHLTTFHVQEEDYNVGFLLDNMLWDH